jgi:hypothetical protein
MSFQIITSASNTVTKSLGAVDNVVDGVSLGTEMFKDAMMQARFEQKVEMFTEANTLVKDTSLTEAQIKQLQSYIPA